MASPDASSGLKTPAVRLMVSAPGVGAGGLADLVELGGGDGGVGGDDHLAGGRVGVPGDAGDVGLADGGVHRGELGGGGLVGRLRRRRRGELDVASPTSCYESDQTGRVSQNRGVVVVGVNLMATSWVSGHVGGRACSAGTGHRPLPSHWLRVLPVHNSPHKSPKQL